MMMLLIVASILRLTMTTLMMQLIMAIAITIPTVIMAVSLWQ